MQAASRDGLIRLKPAKTVVVAGTSSVCDAANAQRVNLNIPTVRRDGDTRVDVARAVAAYAFASAKSAFVATCWSFPDALFAAPAAAKLGLLVANTDCVPRPIGDQLVRLHTTSTTVAGAPRTLTSNGDALRLLLTPPLRGRSRPSERMGWAASLRPSDDEDSSHAVFVCSRA